MPTVKQQASQFEIVSRQLKVSGKSGSLPNENNLDFFRHNDAQLSSWSFSSAAQIKPKA
ncbi:MAG TPA: hypothetical protein VFF39_01215 [Verrucomicrobiae bacterium]|nr:hypothetical protein [Verrucomicrobiae bacterium]